MEHPYCVIGDPGNPPDHWRNGYVPYVYSIAKYQLTNEEWTQFVKATGIGYHKDMTTGILGGFDKPDWAKKPVVYVRYEDVCRYCNWLTSGDPEHGSYDLSGKFPRRVKGAKYVIPNQDEWYKAAYWRSESRKYVNYPTGDAIPELKDANFERGDRFAVGGPYYLADVDAYEHAATPNGVVQMGGNAWEMLEDVARDGSGRWQNCYRGGSFGYTETGLGKSNCDTAPYNGRCYVFGVRLARLEDERNCYACRLKYGIMLGVIRCLRKLKSFAVRLLRN